MVDMFRLKLMIPNPEVWSILFLQEDRENIIRARESGKGALTNPFRLLESKHLGIVFTFAVYSIDLPEDATKEDRIKATAGYLTASNDYSFNPPDVIVQVFPICSNSNNFAELEADTYVR